MDGHMNPMRSLLRAALYLGLALIAAGGSGAARAAARGGQEEFVLWISPAGDDANDGTFEAPLRSLRRAGEMLLADPPGSDVRILLRSDEGEYLNESVVWRYYDPGHATVFEPYPPELPAVFRADAVAPPAGPFFTLEAGAGEPTNIVLRRLRVEDYASTVFFFKGDPENPTGGWNGRNVIEDCTLRDIGNARIPSRPLVYGAVMLVNSVSDTIRGCSFSRFANANTLAQASPEGAFPDEKLDSAGARGLTLDAAATILPIIGVYVSHHSVGTRVLGCAMDTICGDAVRIRDGSDDAVIDSCSFTQTGHNAVCSMWYCEASVESCFWSHPECPSCGAVMRNCRAFGDRYCQSPRLFADLVQIYSRRCAPACRIEERFVSENNVVGPCPP